MNIIERAAQETLESEVKAASLAMQAFPRKANGMTPDDVKFTPEFKTAKQNYNRAFQALRSFNAKYL